MGTQEELAAFLYLVKQDNIEIGQCCVVPQGVFFGSSKIAQIFADKQRQRAKAGRRPCLWLAGKK